MGGIGASAVRTSHSTMCRPGLMLNSSVFHVGSPLLPAMPIFVVPSRRTVWWFANEVDGGEIYEHPTSFETDDKTAASQAYSPSCSRAY